ncbi:MAG: hypothetical protein HRT90_05745, partial [Candidatus Margulisbacteria bacterium]|nr:hypothetical protein [Candidatus Margulisiibacteriota bacterium]
MIQPFLKLVYFIFYKISRLYYIYIRGLKDINIKRPVKLVTSTNRTKPTWPDGAAALFNLQFDDASAMDGTHGAFDYGGDPKGKLAHSYANLMKQHPKLKSDIFLVANPIFKRKGRYRETYPTDTWRLSEHKEAVKHFNSLPNTEFSSHGLTHYQDDIHYFL